MPTARLVCAACGWTPGPLAVDPHPFRCPNAGADDGDHVLRVVGTADFRSPTDSVGLSRTSNPFINYRQHFYSWHVALEQGLSDEDYVSIVTDIDARVATVCGHGFRETPLTCEDALARALRFEDASIRVKNETGNVSGSHKGRHFMGVAIFLKVVERILGKADTRPLAIASCGNAALAAAVIAHAIERSLLVFVPDHASPVVVAELERLGATVCRCTRTQGVAGDPCYLAFRRAVEDGAIPFSCQGNENGLVIEGGKTLGYELLDGLRTSHVGHRTTNLDRMFIQVGGGALASACIQALTEHARTNDGFRMPRVHAVQTRGGYPLKRAYDRTIDRIFTLFAERNPSARVHFSNDDDRSRYLLANVPPSLLDEVFAYARAHRSCFMQPWEEEPRSIAHGILDDETYDWAVVVEGMIHSGGFPIVVEEETLEEANRVARETTGINVDHTGTSGLAGLVALCTSLSRPKPSERVAVLFTGTRRRA